MFFQKLTDFVSRDWLSIRGYNQGRQTGVAKPGKFVRHNGGVRNHCMVQQQFLNLLYFHA